ncbi:MAG: hypothetical protein ABI597_08750 [Gammaproteobacteria bacterium]
MLETRGNLANLAGMDSAPFKSTYAKLFVVMTKTQFDVLTMSDTNPALRKSAVIAVQTTQEEQKLSNVNALNETKADIDTVISAYENSTSQNSRQLFLVYSEQRNQLEEKLNGINTASEALTVNFVEVSQSIFEKIRNALTTIDALDSDELQQVKSGSQDVVNQLKAADKERTTFAARATKFLKDCGALSTQLVRLHTSAYNDLPASKQQAAPSPQQSSIAQLGKS